MLIGRPITVQVLLAPFRASSQATHPLSTGRCLAQRVRVLVFRSPRHDQTARAVCQELVLHCFQARLWFVAPLEEAGELLGTCFDGLRFAVSPLRRIVHQCGLSAWSAVSVFAADSLVSAEPVAMSPQRSGPLDVVDQAVAGRHLQLAPIRRKEHARQVPVQESQSACDAQHGKLLGVVARIV